MYVQAGSELRDIMSKDTVMYDIANSAAGNAVLNAGLKYGPTLLQQGVEQGEKSMLTYLPLLANLQRYFAVDNRYVRRKMALLLFPFRGRYPRLSQLSSTTTGSAPHTMAGGAAVSPTTMANFDLYDTALSHQAGLISSASSVSYAANQARLLSTGSSNKNNSSSSDNSHAFSSQSGVAGSIHSTTLPTVDHYSFDLYIPLMGAVTYIIISAFLYGLLYTRSVTAEYLVGTLTVLLMWFVAEILTLKALSYVLPVVPDVKLLDILALCGYKYVYICLVVLAYSVLNVNLPSVKVAVGSLLTYCVAANSYFAYACVTRLYSRSSDGRVTPRARLLSYLAALVQLPAFIWMCARSLR